MNTYDDELCLLANIYNKPDLIKQLVLPIDAINDNLHRFVLQAFIYTYKEHGYIDIASLLKEHERAFTGKYSQNDFMKVVIEISDYAENFIVEDFDYYQKLLFEDYKDKLINNAINEFKDKKLTQDELVIKINEISSKTIDTNTGYKTIDEIKELVLTNNKTIPFRLEKLSNRIKLQEHDLMVISARTGIGKSGFALNLLEDLSDRKSVV